MTMRHFTSVQFSHSVVSDSATPWTAAHQASLSFTSSQSLLRLMSVESAVPSSQAWSLEAPFTLSCTVPPHFHRQVYPYGSLEKVGNIFPGLQGTWAVSMSPPITRAVKEHLPKVPTAPF